jgi:predicted RNA-binding Zn ribbon-like protein
MAPHEFELVGGHPALDFINTVHDWTVDEARDYLTTFSDAARFGEAVGLLTRTEARQIAGAGNEVELAELRVLRSVLERIARSLVSARAPRPGDLRALATLAAAAAGATRLRATNGQLRRVISLDEAGASLLRLRIADAALALFTSPRVARMKACPAWGWYFLDVSKNRSRRWCSMSTCGASAKARRYYQRVKAAR